MRSPVVDPPREHEVSALEQHRALRHGVFFSKDLSRGICMHKQFASAHRGKTQSSLREIRVKLITLHVPRLPVLYCLFFTGK